VLPVSAVAHNLMLYISNAEFSWR